MRSRLVALAGAALALAGCGGGGGESAPPRDAAPPPSTTAASTTGTAPTPTAEADPDELPALPTGDVTVGDLATARSLCRRYRREPDKVGARTQVTFRVEDDIDGLVCTFPR